MTLEQLITMSEEEIRNLSEEEIFSICIKKNSPEDEATATAKKIALRIFKTAPIEIIKLAALATILEEETCK